MIRLLRICQTIKIFFIIISTNLFSQNVDMYIALLNEGNSSGVRDQLPELISKFPNDPDVLFLKALLTQDGMSALEQFGNLLDKYPESKYAPDAAIKIGEYFFARGLYSQASSYLSKVLTEYPNYPEVQRVIDLMVNSFQAIGEEDSARYYIYLYKSMYPGLDISEYGLREIHSSYNSRKTNNDLSSNQKHFLVQIGAFSAEKNAQRLKLQVSQIGYNVVVSPIETNGRLFHAVRVVGFPSKKSADKAGMSIKKKLGIDYRVLYRPKG